MAAKRNRPIETDLKKLKSLAHSFLELDIQPTKMSPLVVKHPFTDSGIVGLHKEGGNTAVADLTSDSASLQAWREQCGRLIDEAEKPFELFLMITKPYKLGFLKYAAPFLSEQDTALFLSQAWIITEAPNADPNLSKRELLSLFRSVDPQMLMDEEEYELFRSLDDVVTVYRGVTSYNAKNVMALSWTLNRDTAEWFAHRFGEQGTPFFVLEVTEKMPYIHFTEEQKNRAASVDLEEFLRMRGEKLTRSGGEKRMASDHSVTIRGSEWYDHATEKGGGPISFVRDFYGLSYPEAVLLLLDGEQGVEYPMAKQKEEAPPKPFELPPVNGDCRRVYAYLLKQRHIDREVVSHFVKAGLPHRARAVYMYLRDRSGAAGSCWPGINTIAADLHLSRSTVKRALNELTAKGYLQKESRFRPNGSSTSNLYTVR